MNRIRPFERTPPAGRFDSRPGRTPTGDANVRIDVLPEDRPVETIFQQTLAAAAPRRRPL